jgi:hypothetical protein
MHATRTQYPMKASLVTITGAAELLEKDRATLVRALRGTKPDRVEGKRQFFKLRTIFDRLLEHERGTIEAGKKVVDEHRLLAKARREKVEMEVAVKKGELVDAATMERLLELEYRVVGERLLGIAVQASDKIAPDEIVRREFAREVIAVAVHEALLELSAPADLLEQAVNGRERRGGRIGNGGMQQEDEERVE